MMPPARARPRQFFELARRLAAALDRARGIWRLTPLVLLAGCGGGGGGSSSGVDPGMPVVQSFTSWTALGPNQKVTAQGMTTSAAFTTGVGGTVNITSPFGAANTAGSSATITTSPTFTAVAGPDLTALQIAAPAGGVSWDEAVAGGGTVVCGNTGQCTATKGGGTTEATFIDPYFQPGGWNYQSFGVWSTGVGTTGTIGAISFGAPTPVNAVPVLGSATYTGLTAGVYVNAAGNLVGTAADMSATVNFVARSISFATTNTMTSTGGVATPNAGLNLTGTGSYVGGSAQFSILNLATQNGQLSGRADGRFYGPAAQEIGGVYSLTGVGGNMGGAFGGKKP